MVRGNVSCCFFILYTMRIGWETSTPSWLSQVWSQISSQDTSSVSHCSRLCFWTRPLLTLPHHKISTYSYLRTPAVSSRRPPIRRWWAGPIRRIFIGRNKKIDILGISKTDDFLYRIILFSALRWGIRGECINWLRTPTAYARSGLMIVK